jgi:fimbrial chaperone protein
LDGKGALVVEREVPGWYVLAGSTSKFEIALTSGECGRLGRVEIEVNTEGGSWRGSTGVEPGACTP